MTDKELKKLKDDLWHSADMLRASAHLAANKYGQPILGLIFLRYADILFKQHKAEITEEYQRKIGTRAEKTMKQVSIEKCGFYLPECACFDLFLKKSQSFFPKSFVFSRIFPKTSALICSVRSTNTSWVILRCKRERTAAHSIPRLQLFVIW